MNELSIQITDLRSFTQGKATFTMEFLTYRPAPAAIQEEIIAQIRKSRDANEPAGAE